MEKRFYVYVLASQKNGTLYIGVTSDIARRLFEHKASAQKGFTAKYHVSRLVYYEAYLDSISAIEREKALKKWNRDWKIRLIEERNPEWLDLWESLNQWDEPSYFLFLAINRHSREGGNPPFQPLG